MSETANVEDLRAFLLGGLSDRERDRIEELLLRDGELFELSLALEDELVDELLRGGLRPAEAQVLTDSLRRLPDGSLRVQMAKALQIEQQSRLDRTASAPRRRWRERALVSWATQHGLYKAAILLFAIGMTVSMFRNARLASLVHETEAKLAHTQARIHELEQERGSPGTIVHRKDEVAGTVPAEAGSRIYAAPSRAPRSTRAVAVLTAGALRGSRVPLPVVRITTQEVIDLDLDLGADEYPTYRAALCDADGREIASAGRLMAQSSDQRIVVTFSIPADWIQKGDYFVALDGITPSGQREPIHRYYFRAQIDSPVNRGVHGR